MYPFMTPSTGAGTPSLTADQAAFNALPPLDSPSRPTAAGANYGALDSASPSPLPKTTDSAKVTRGRGESDYSSISTRAL